MAADPKADPNADPKANGWKEKTGRQERGSPYTCPHALSPSLDQQTSLHTHPPNRRQPALAANSATRHTGITGVTLPIDDDDSSPAPSHATRTAPCRVPPPPPLHATTISLTAGCCPLRAAAATAVYISLLPHSRCPHLLPFAAKHLTPVPLPFGPTTVYPRAPALGRPPTAYPLSPCSDPTYFLYVVCVIN